MTDFVFSVEIPEFFDKFELKGYWNEKEGYGVISLYDNISRIFSLNFDEFEELAKSFSKIRGEMKKDHMEYAFRVYDYREKVKNLAKETFIGKEA